MQYPLITNNYYLSYKMERIKIGEKIIMPTNFTKVDSIISTILIIFSAFVFAETLSYPKTAALFPQVISFLIFLFSIGLLLRDLRKKKSNLIKNIDLFKKDDFKVVIALLIGLIIYPVMLNYFGYFISTSLLVYCTIYFLQEEKRKFIIIISIFIVIILFFIFEFLMKIYLPKGIFFN